MPALRVVAFVFFVLAALGGFGWLIREDVHGLLGLVSVGFACLVASTLPSPPARS